MGNKTHTCGIDIGSRSIEIAIWNAEIQEIAGYRISDTGLTPTVAAKMLLQDVLVALRMTYDDLVNIVVTGYGRKSFPLSATTITEITCHARGIARLFPEARTVIDIGGQDSKVIGLKNDGHVRDFAMNDRCAAGTGRFLEMTSTILETPLEEMGSTALKAQQGVEINSMCAVFAESEIVSLVSKGQPKEEILLGVIQSVAKRITGLIGRVGLTEKVVLTGGVAKNIGIVWSLEQELRTTLIVPEEPQVTGALGAALVAADNVNF